jgi:hypothetical protein
MYHYPLLPDSGSLAGVNSPGPDWSRVPDSAVPARKVVLPTTMTRAASRFIPPMPLGWFQRACRLPGKAAVLAVVLWYTSRLKGSKTFVLTQARLDGFGISRHAKYRALKALEDAGLIAVSCGSRKSPEVTLLDLPADPV